MEQPNQIITEPIPPAVATSSPPQPPIPKPNKFPLIFLIVLGLISVGGLVFAGYWLRQSQFLKPPLKTQNLTPAPIISPTPEVKISYPEYGHASDFSWAAGILKWQPLEGGCWTLSFSENPEKADAYNGILALKVPTHLKEELKDKQFVVVTGKVAGDEFSMACPPTVYEVGTIQLNELTLAPDPTAGWKIYINQDLGYSIKYSTGYIRLICPGGELILLERQAMKEDTVEWNTCEGGIFEIKTQKEQFEIPQSGPYEIDGIKYSKLAESKEVLVDSIKAQEYKIIDKELLLGQNFSQFWVVFSNKGKNYKIVSLGFERTLLDLMLPTFKFLP